MAQLNLNIPSRLVYSSGGFMLHAGVRELFSRVTTTLTQPHFAIAFVTGGSRSGKTHFSVALADGLAAQGFTVFAVDGPDLSQWINDRISRTVVRSQEAIVVDDAHCYLEQLGPGASGEFVNMVEAFRRGKGRIALISKKTPEEFDFDDHVRSRILPGAGYVIGPPAEAELAPLFAQMARQRGMLFSTRKLEYFMKRVGRDVAAVDHCLNNIDAAVEASGGEEQLPLMDGGVPRK